MQAGRVPLQVLVPRRDFALLAATLNKAAKRGADHGVDDEARPRC